MKANELMIGDYVLVKPSKMLIKIAAVHHKKVAYHACINRLTWIRESLLEPIPLTIEVLERNGMHLYNRRTNNLMEECNHSDCFEEDKHYRLELSLDYEGRIRWTINADEYTIMPLDYVHQLQQAMRLCKIKGKEIKLWHALNLPTRATTSPPSTSSTAQRMSTSTSN